MKILPLPDGKFVVAADGHEDFVASNHYVALQVRDSIIEQRAIPLDVQQDWDYDHENE